MPDEVAAWPIGSALGRECLRYRIGDIPRTSAVNAALASASNALSLRSATARHSRVVIAATLLFGLGLILSAVPSRVAAADIADISVFALGPLDGRAVFKFPDGSMAVLKLGDELSGTRARLVQVLSDRAVLEDLREEPGQPAVRELVWIYKADAQGRSVIQRFTPQAPQPTRIERVK